MRSFDDCAHVKCIPVAEILQLSKFQVSHGLYWEYDMRSWGTICRVISHLTMEQSHFVGKDRRISYGHIRWPSKAITLKSWIFLLSEFAIIICMEAMEFRVYSSTRAHSCHVWYPTQHPKITWRAALQYLMTTTKDHTNILMCSCVWTWYVKEHVRRRPSYEECNWMDPWFLHWI